MFITEAQIVIKGDRGISYELGTNSDGTVSCTCPGYIYREHCKHATLLKALMVPVNLEAVTESSKNVDAPVL